ncbi:MAG: LysR substrate-binding domain-containing protein [Gordonibacter pamelaeae]
MVFAAKAPNKPDLCFEHAVSHELVAFMSKDHPLANRSSLSLDELHGYTVCTYRTGTPIGEEVDEVLAEYDLPAVREYEDEITMGGMVASDPTLCGLATLSIGLKSFSGISIVPLRDVPRDFHRIYMVYKRDKFRSRAVESFLELAADFRLLPEPSPARKNRFCHPERRPKAGVEGSSAKEGFSS